MTTKKLYLANLLIISLLSAQGGSFCFAQNNSPKTKTVIDSLEVCVFFHVNKTKIDTLYHENGKNIREFAAKYQKITEDKEINILSFDVVSSASPEGYSSENEGLSNGRAKSIIELVNSYVDISDLPVNLRSMGSNWTRFRRMVQEDTDLICKDQVLEIIDSEPQMINYNGKIIDDRTRKLQNLYGGSTFAYLQKNIFPELRASLAYFFYSYEVPDEQADTTTAVPIILPVIAAAADSSETAPVPAQDTVAPVLVAPILIAPALDTVAPIQDTIAPINYEIKKKLVFAFRTNLLLPLLNVGFEVPIGNRWSIGFDHYYPWLWRYWPTQSNQYCFELMWEHLEVRYWFGDNHKPGEQNWLNRLSGHSVGLFGDGGYYDIGYDWNGKQGEFGAVGIDYVYGLPLCNGKIHMEFSIGIGYLYTTYRTYDVFEEGGHLYRRLNGNDNYHYFGPLKLGVSFVVPLFQTYKREISE